MLGKGEGKRIAKLKSSIKYIETLLLKQNLMH